MSYLGENRSFSFRDSFCEPVDGTEINSSSAAELGRSISSLFSRFLCGCESEEQLPYLYALCGGISECGRDVFISECTDFPSFRFGAPIMSAECGIYISGKGNRISFCGGDGYPMRRNLMRSAMEAVPSEKSVKCGKIVRVSSLRNIYINNLKDTFGESLLPAAAGVSCGNKSVRTLWQEFFSDSDDSLIFQISEDGQRVNAYSTELGFISYDRLILAQCITLWKNGQTVFLPESFHYAADSTASSLGYKLKRYDPENGIPYDAAKQRFLGEPLYLCLCLAVKNSDFYEAVRSAPQFTSAKREIPAVPEAVSMCGKSIVEPHGIIRIAQSGKKRISLVAQAYDAETAAELCSSWQEKIRQMSSCTNLFHSES